ncbi:ABC transporter permease [Thermococcus sp.]
MLWGFQLEFMKGIRTKKLWAILVIMLIFYVPVIYFMKQGNVSSEKEAIAVIINYVMNMALLFLGILAIVFGAGAVNKEIEDGTIRIALSKSVTRLEYFLGKFLAQGLVLFLAIVLTSAVTVTGLKWVGVSVGSVFTDVVLLNLLLLLVMLEFIAIGYIMSTFIRSSGTSLGVALAVFFVIYLVIPAYVDYKIYVAHEKMPREELEKIKEDYYTKYLFFSPVAQLEIITDNTLKEVTKKVVSSHGVYEGISYEYVGLWNAIKTRAVNVMLMLAMTLVYLGIATWRFLRMDLR